MDEKSQKVLRTFLFLKTMLKELMEKERKEVMENLHPILDHSNPEMNEKIARKLFKKLK